ncbi:MAG: TMEM165/GDT1 family protein [Chitinophagales bacterium]
MSGVEIITCISTYLIILLAELGDKTQIAVLFFAGNNPAKRWTVLIASAIALVTCVALEITIGVSLARYIGPAMINRIAGAVFLLLGIITIGQMIWFSDQITPKQELSALNQESVN